MDPVRQPLPKPPEDDRAARFSVVLALEMQARRQTSGQALRFFAVNETRKAAPYRQAFLVETAGGRARITAISSISSVERDAPLVRSFEHVATAFRNKLQDDARLKPQYFLLGAFSEEDDSTRDYPFKHLCWLPLPQRWSAADTALLLARDTPWRQHEMALLEPLADTYGHALDTLQSRRRVWKAGGKWRPILYAGIVAGLVAVCLLPVRLTALAPAEVVAAKPIVVSAPVEGVIADLPVDPNTQVREGDLILTFVDTKLRNAAEVAARNAVVAEAKHRKAVQGAFGSARDNQEVAIARAELDVKKAEAAYAAEMLERASVRAKASGLLLYSSKSDWIGRPVVTGERIMEIADPRRLELQIDLPLADIVTAKDGGRVVFYLDSDPLHPVEGTLYRVSYQATLTGESQYAFRLLARIPLDDEHAPRIGTRGTAQVYGERVSLFFYLFRRPITALRQRLGI